MRKLLVLSLAAVLLAPFARAVTPTTDKPSADKSSADKSSTDSGKSATNAPAPSSAGMHITVPEAEKMLPDDTLVLFTIPDFNKARAIYRNSPQGRLWNDPAMKAFKENFLSKFTNDYLGPLEKDLGVHFIDYTSLPQGQFTLAMVQNGWAAKEGHFPGAVMLLDVRDQSALLTKDLDDLKKKWINAGKTMRTQKIRDVDFSVVALNDANLGRKPKKHEPLGPGLPDAIDPPEPKDAEKPELLIGQADSLLIVGNSDKVIEKILARLGGGTVNVLSDLAAFDANRAMFHDAPFYAWVNTKVLVDIYGKANPVSDSEADANPFALQMDKILAALGLNGLNSAAVNCKFSNEGSEFNLTLSTPESGRKGLLKILTGEPKDYTVPAFVPADAVKFQRWRLDGQKTWTAIRKTLGDMIPALSGGIDLVLNSVDEAAKQKDPSFDLNKNLFGNLGDDMISYQKSPRGLTPAELNSPPSIFLVSSPNAEQLVNALQQVLYAMYPQQAGGAKSREVLGHKIYSIPLPSGPAPRNAAPAPAKTISYTFSGGYLAISSDPAMLEEYLRSSETPPKSLRETPGLGDAMQKVAGSGSSLFGFSNESEDMRVNFDAMKKDSAASETMNPLAGLAPIMAAMGMGDPKAKDWVDVSLLPSFDRVSKYFYFVVYGGNSTGDSINFKVFAPTPPELKK